MRKLFAVAALAAAMIVGAASPSQAVAISFAPANQTVLLGSSVSVDVVVSGLGVQGAQALGAFDFDVLLSNPAIVTFGSYTLGSWLGALGTESDDFSGGFDGTNRIGLSQLSYLNMLDPADLVSFQAPAGGSFTIATLTFTAASVGTTFLDAVAPAWDPSAGGPILSDENGTAGGLQATLSRGRINVIRPGQVPEPTGLVGAGIGLALIARRFVNRRRVA